MRIADHVIQSLRSAGLRGLALKAARKAVRPLVDFGQIVFFTRELADLPPDAEPKLKLCLRYANPSEAEWLRGGSAPGRSVEVLRDRFRRGDLCVVATDPEGQPTHTRWIARERSFIPELGMDVVLDPDAAYIYDGYTSPSRRGLRIDGAVRAFIFHNMRLAGVRRIYSYVRGDNPVGLRAAARWQTPATRIKYLKPRGLRSLVFGGRSLPALSLRRPLFEDYDDESRVSRFSRSREWFESWLAKPLSQRSTGCDQRSDEYFRSTGAYIASALHLDATSDFVLDVGCDSAMVSRYVAPHCRKFAGVDPILGMLVDGSRHQVLSSTGDHGLFTAADGRLLPFPSGVFSKAYCCAVIHMLPSREDGIRLVRELVRVCRPGAKILIASVPDTRKKTTVWRHAWRQASSRERAKLLASLLLPNPLRTALRELTGIPPSYCVAQLTYDLGRVKRQLEQEGKRCRIEDFPAEYESADFKRGRSNLIIEL